MIILILALFIGGFLIFNLLYFILPSLSPIPFFPTNGKDLPLIVKTLLERKSPNTKYEIPDTIIDLGAGTGTVIFSAAKEALQKSPHTHFVAVEIHPLLVFIMRLRHLLHPNRNNIHIIRTNLFDLNYKKIPIFIPKNIKYSTLNTIYLYVGPFVMSRLKPILASFPKKTRVISYMYEIPGWEKRCIAKKNGKKMLYIYSV